MKRSKNTHSNAAAYGGEGWQPRLESMKQEIGGIWHPCGVNSEWAQLKAVLLHEPGEELSTASKPDAFLMLAPLNRAKACKQHKALARAFEVAGISVHYVHPATQPPPNQMFVADLMFMTPEGVILGRPASTVRAGEERWVARRLADLGIPIVHSVGGTATFEGADAAWIDTQTVMLGRGIRTNAEGTSQMISILNSLGIRVIQVDIPVGMMHLMGTLRFVDQDLAIAWPGRLAVAAVEALQGHGYQVVFLPDESEARQGMALNFVTLGPRKIIMPAGNPKSQAFYENLGIVCQTVQVDELLKAAGAIGCLTGIIERKIV
jgi:N-dimethylarginine dimethylaminohydrolase